LQEELRAGTTNLTGRILRQAYPERRSIAFNGTPTPEKRTPLVSRFHWTEWTCYSAANESHVTVGRLPFDLMNHAREFYPRMDVEFVVNMIQVACNREDADRKFTRDLFTLRTLRDLPRNLYLAR
jgi:hypothetical protein